MKKLAVALASIAFATMAHAADLMQPLVTISSVTVAVTTYTTMDAAKRVVTTTSTGNESAPTDPSVGLSLEGVYAVRVGMTSSTNATAAKNILCYVYSPAAGAWLRFPDWDLTSIASTAQGWAPIEVKVRQGRVTWVPNSALSGTLSLYMVAQPVIAGTAAP